MDQRVRFFAASGLDRKMVFGFLRRFPGEFDVARLLREYDATLRVLPPSGSAAGKASRAAGVRVLDGRRVRATLPPKAGRHHRRVRAPQRQRHER